MGTDGIDMIARRRGFTLIEMLTTVAVLIIVLGLMVSLARYVRRRSAEDLTRKILVSLHQAMRQYTAEHGRPAIAPPADKGALEESSFARWALEDNRQFVLCLRGDRQIAATTFAGLPLSIYDQTTVRDAWGMPIVFMPAMHRQVGMAPGDTWFFFSAGPDRLYLTRDDNQYSYESAGVEAP